MLLSKGGNQCISCLSKKCSAKFFLAVVWVKSLKLCGDNTCQALDTHTSLGDLEQFSVSQENNLKKRFFSMCVFLKWPFVVNRMWKSNY